MPRRAPARLTSGSRRLAESGRPPEPRKRRYRLRGTRVEQGQFCWTGFFPKVYPFLAPPNSVCPSGHEQLDFSCIYMDKNNAEPPSLGNDLVDQAKINTRRRKKKDAEEKKKEEEITKLPIIQIQRRQQDRENCVSEPNLATNQKSKQTAHKLRVPAEPLRGTFSQTSVERADNLLSGFICCYSGATTTSSLNN